MYPQNTVHPEPSLACHVVDDIDMMTTDEVAYALGVTKLEAGRIKTQRNLELGSHEAYREYDTETENFEPLTPSVSETAFNWDTTGPIPRSKSVLGANANATYVQLAV
jgi:hypothetical protein